MDIECGCRARAGFRVGQARRPERSACCLAAAFLVAAVALGSGCGKARGGDAAATATEISGAKVHVARLEQRPFRRTVLAHGNVLPVHYAEICARIDGALDTVNFDEGDVVREGEVLFQTDQVNLENQVEVAKQELKVAETVVRQAEIDLSVMQLQAEKAHVDLARAKTLIAGQAISQDQYELTDLNAQRADAVKAQADAALAHARARHEQALSNIGIAGKNLEDSRVKANFDGVVTARFKEPGEYADKAKPVLRMENTTILEFQASISAEYYAAVRPGETRIVLRNLEGVALGEVPVGYRSPSIDPASRTFTLKANLPAGGPFVSGMLTVGELILAEREGRGVPDVAVLLRADGKHAVFVVDQGRAKAIGVKPGLSTDGFTEITGSEEPLDGLDIIVQGQAFLDDGAAVAIAAETRTSAERGTRSAEGG
jgi:membrane fusion protein (multidrug efflux system)